MCVFTSSHQSVFVCLYVCTLSLEERLNGFEQLFLEVLQISVKNQHVISTPTKGAVSNAHYLLGLARIKLINRTEARESHHTFCLPGYFAELPSL